MTVIESGSVLVAVSEYGEFGALLSLSREIELRLGLHPVFVFAHGYGLVHEHGQLVELEKWSWIQLGSDVSSVRTQLDADSESGYFRTFSEEVLKQGNGLRPAPWDPKLTLLSTVVMAYRRMARVGYTLLGQRRRVTGKGDAMRMLVRELRQAERIFLTYSPRLILSGQDYALSVTAILSMVGERFGIRTAIVPFNMPPTTRELIETFAHSGHNQLRGFVDRWLASKVCRRWLNVRRGKVYSRVNLVAAWVADRLGLTPGEPWLPNSGRGVVFVPSRWAFDYYKKAGIPPAQLRLTGAAWSDVLVRGAASSPDRKSRLLASICRGKKQHRSQDKNWGGPRVGRLIVVSWPPNQYPRKALGCATYQDLCQQFVQIIQAIHEAGLAYVAVSLHPTLTDPKLLSSLQRAGVHVLRGGLIEYVDCADIFVSTVSSTSFWALQCGIPTINFDGYLYGYTEFDEAGAMTIRTPAELYTTCAALLENPQRLTQVRSRIAERAPHFSEATGMNLDRIMSGLAELSGVDGHALAAPVQMPERALPPHGPVEGARVQDAA